MRSLFQLPCFVHLNKDTRRKRRKFLERELASRLLMGYVILAPENESRITWKALTPPTPLPAKSSPLAIMTLSVDNCSYGPLGGSKKSSSLTSCLCETLLDVDLEIWHIGHTASLRASGSSAFPISSPS